MILHFGIEQGSADWFEIKWGKIGGTRSSGLFDDKINEALVLEILSEQIEPFELEESYTSYDMLRGQELEPVARGIIARDTFTDFHECGWIESSEFSFTGISPDGVTTDGIVQCEIKCPARKKHTATIRANQIPSDNIKQCLHAFVVNEKLEKLIFCSYRPESPVPVFTKELTPLSLVDLGTKAKPVVKSVREWVEVAKSNLRLIQSVIEQEKELIMNRNTEGN
jgi:hypothetical protein